LSSEFPRRPRIAKGAIVLLRPNSEGIIGESNTSAFIFQYNPERLTRTISSLNCEEASKEEENKHDANSIVEQINLNLEFDATDQLEQPDEHIDVLENGLHPTLAALESILYSQSKTEDQKLPVVLFIWGPNRVIPIWIDSLKVTEEAFDSNLNPIRVKIELSMRVRNLSELKKGSSEYAIYASHLDQRQMLTRLYRKNEVDPNFLKQMSQNIRKYLTLKKVPSKKHKKM
jgi:hypothetical protein